MLSHTFVALKQRRLGTSFVSTFMAVCTTESGSLPPFTCMSKRFSTRPFLESIEKRWVAYQLLCGLRDCHAKGVFPIVMLANLRFTTATSRLRMSSSLRGIGHILQTLHVSNRHISLKTILRTFPSSLTHP